MLLQNIFKEDFVEEQVYSVTIDDESTKVEYSTPPQHLEEIGFILDIDQSDGTMSERMMDVIINYRLTNLSVIVEVPSHLLFNKTCSIKYLLQIANNIDFAVALLPPGHECVPADFTNQQYKEVIVEAVRELLTKQNFDKTVFPISNYFEYLMLEVIMGEEKLINFKAKDKFIHESFIAKMSKEEIHDFKNSIRQELHAHYGGQEEFNKMAKVMIASILNRASESYDDFISPIVEKNVKQKIQEKLEKQ